MRIMMGGWSARDQIKTEPGKIQRHFTMQRKFAVKVWIVPKLKGKNKENHKKTMKREVGKKSKDEDPPGRSRTRKKAP